MKLTIKYKLIYLLFGFLSLQTSAQQDLDAYLQMAAENNPELRAAYAEFEAALQESPQVSALPDPTLSGSAFGLQMIETRLGSQMAKFQLMQMFPWFGTLSAKEDVANLRAEAKFQQYLEVRNRVFFEIKSAHAEIYEVEKTIELQEENLQILDSFRELALSKFRSGSSKMVNVVRIDIEREGALTEIELLKDRLRPLKTEFNLMLNRQPQAPVQIQDTLVFAEKDILKEESQILENHPRVQQVKKQKESYQIQQEVARKEGLPMLGVGLDYTIIKKRQDANPPKNGQDAIMPMFSVSLPIFRKKNKAARKEAEYFTTAMEQEQQVRTNQLRSEYEMTLFELKRSRKLINLYNRQIRSSKQANRLLISGFGNATEDFEEVLRMNQDILMLKTQLLNSVKEGVTAQAKMDYLSAKTE